MIESLWNQVSPYYHIMLRQTELNDPLTGIDYHRRMLEAMRKRNPEEVCRWLRTDLTESTDFVINVFKYVAESCASCKFLLPSPDRLEKDPHGNGQAN